VDEIYLHTGLDGELPRLHLKSVVHCPAYNQQLREAQQANGILDRVRHRLDLSSVGPEKRLDNEVSCSAIAPHDAFEQSNDDCDNDKWSSQKDHAPVVESSHVRTSKAMLRYDHAHRWRSVNAFMLCPASPGHIEK
jgi:hypothetical protein